MTRMIKFCADKITADILADGCDVTNDDIIFKFRRIDVKNILITNEIWDDEVFEKNPDDLMLMVSEDGKDYVLAFGLYVDGEMIDIRDLVKHVKEDIKEGR